MTSSAARANQGRTSIVCHRVDEGDAAFDFCSRDDGGEQGEGAVRRIDFELTKRENGLRRKAVVRVDTGMSAD